VLLDGQEVEQPLGTALAGLPALEHLSISRAKSASNREAWLTTFRTFPGDVLRQLPLLTFLELDRVEPRSLEGDSADLQHLSVLTRLADLRLSSPWEYNITASMLSSAQCLTHLKLQGVTDCSYEPAVLAGKTLLQHLELVDGCPTDGTAGFAQLLSQLQQLQQLTHLVVKFRLGDDVSAAPAAGYAALTASSKLQQLVFEGGHLPAGAWQHIFPTGRQLPHLQGIKFSPFPMTAAGPESTRLVSCCPGLQAIDMRHMQFPAGMLGALQALSSLTKLNLWPAAPSEGFEGLCQLTGLQELYLHESHEHHGAAEGDLVQQVTQLQQLTRLQQLTNLHWSGCLNGVRCCFSGCIEVSHARAVALVLIGTFVVHGGVWRGQHCCCPYCCLACQATS
jgi:hypothetical protein